MSAPLDLADFLSSRSVDAEIVSPGVPMPTVEAAAAAMGCAPEQIFKSIVFQGRDGRCAIAVACGLARVDARRFGALVRLEDARLAKADVVLRVTGYPAGGTPPVGHRERLPVIVDARVAAQPWGYAGGGRPELLVRMRSEDIVGLNEARIEDLVGEPPGHAAT